MYGEMFIDHTSVHSVVRSDLRSEELAARTREVLQLVEELLFADVLWLCDTVTSETFDHSMRLASGLRSSGVTSSRNDGVLRVAFFSQSQIEHACRESAARLYDFVSDLTAGDLEKSVERLGYPTRPIGAQEFSYDRVVGLRYGSPQAEEHLQGCFRGKGWIPSSALSLANCDLYSWLAECHRSFGGMSESAMLAYNILSRWKFNEQLAHLLDGEGAGVSYAPAYGRARAIEALHAGAWPVRLASLEAFLRNASEDAGAVLQGLGEFAPSKEMGLPLFGVGVLRALPVNCTLEHLGEGIARARENRALVGFKSWLAEASEEDIPRVAQEAATEFVTTYSRGAKSAPQKKGKYKLVFELPIMPTFLKVSREEEYSGSTFREKMVSLRRHFTLSPEATKLVALLDSAFGPDGEEARLMERVRDLVRHSVVG